MLVPGSVSGDVHNDMAPALEVFSISNFPPVLGLPPAIKVRVFLAMTPRILKGLTAVPTSNVPKGGSIICDAELEASKI